MHTLLSASSGWRVYVPWDINLFYEAVGNLRSQAGVAINIGFWIFLIVTGIYLVFNIVNSFGR